MDEEYFQKSGGVVVNIPHCSVSVKKVLTPCFPIRSSITMGFGLAADAFIQTVGTHTDGTCMERWLQFSHEGGFTSAIGQPTNESLHYDSAVGIIGSR